ncbi:MAG: hypothetical protein PHR64_00145 [Candidatus Shapirobacteria bacterium]|nr:hypothetical protein [Candidatus Shapirobacteria bacterium]MDD5073596.1 hypothetical protein [Candidatus Shapirobacteria bacterium]MDD5481349.1 hypothetical protein [Candidatus Shapirobacteria bacterium]
MLKENGTLVALFILVFVILGLFWWFDRQGQSLIPALLTSTPSSTPKDEIDETAIKDALLKNHNQSQDRINLVVLKIEGNFAQGIATFSGDERVWPWLAHQKEAGGDWILVHDGQGLPVCQELTEFNFPSGFAGQCWDQDKGLVVAY